MLDSRKNPYHQDTDKGDDTVINVLFAVVIVGVLIGMVYFGTLFFDK